MKEFFTLHRTIKLRLIMVFIGVLCFSTVNSSMTIYYNKYLGAGITGILLIVSSVMVFVVGLWAGHLSDKHGRRPLMLFATIVTTSGAALATFSNSPWLFAPWLTYVGFLVLNFGYGFFNTASQAMMVDLTTPENRKGVYSLQYWAINLAVLFGSALSGWFFRDYLVWLLLAITLEEFLSFLLTLFFIDESFDPKKVEHKPESNILKAYFSVIKDKTFMYFCFSSIFISMIFSQSDFYLPVHLSDSFKTTTVLGLQIYGQRMLTIFLIINTIMIVLFMTSMNKLTKNWSRALANTLGIALQGTGFVIAFLGHVFVWEVIAAFIATLGEMILVPSNQALRADLMEGDKVGTYTGAISVTQPIASALCGLSVSVSLWIGNVGMALFMIFVTLFGAAFALKSIRLHERRLSSKQNS